MTNASEVLVRQPELATGGFVATRAPVPQRLNHLRALESESIHILREAAAEFARPVMLYSIGKDSSVMLRLAQKAFFPGRIPFPLLHVDTSYKFPEMIEFRDSYPRQIGAELIVHRNQEALDAGANPFSLGTQKCCGLLKTKSLLDALAEAVSMRLSAEHAATRRNRAPRSAFIPSVIHWASGTRRTSGPSYGIFSIPTSAKGKAFAYFRFPTGPSSTFGFTSTWSESRSCRSISRANAMWFFAMGRSS